jgi:O-antigen ligase
MTIWLIIPALLLFAFVAVQKREWAVYLIILLLPSYQIRFSVSVPGFGPVPMTFLESLILLLFAAELASLVRSGEFKNFFQNQIKKPLARSFLILLFLLSSGAAVFVSPEPLLAAGIYKAFFVEPVLFFFVLLSVIDSEQKKNGLIKSLVLLALALSVFGIYQYLTLANLPFYWWDTGVAARRITSLVNHPNALAHLLGPLLGMMLVFLGVSRIGWKRKKMLLASSALGLVALFLSFSRAGWLALFASVIFFGLFTEHRKKIITASLIMLVLVLAVPVSRDKLVSLLTGNDLSQQNRYVLWSAAADIIKKSPLTGVGLRGFHEAYKNYPLGPDRVVQNYPHNFFLNFWVEIGLVGVLSVLGLLVLFYKQIIFLFRKHRATALAIAAGMTMILLHGQVDVPYFKNDLSVLFWTILALPYLKGSHKD